jgi:hypothetical protein
MARAGLQRVRGAASAFRPGHLCLTLPSPAEMGDGEGTAAGPELGHNVFFEG